MKENYEILVTKYGPTANVDQSLMRYSYEYIVSVILIILRT